MTDKYTIRKMQSADLLEMHFQDSQLGYAAQITKDFAESLSGLTACDDGKPRVCFGLKKLWPGRQYAWMFLDRRATPALLIRAVKFARNWLNTLQQNPEFRRIETTAMVDHDEQERWLKLIGFETEGYMRYYDHEGRDHIMMARISGG